MENAASHEPGVTPDPWRDLLVVNLPVVRQVVRRVCRRYRQSHEDELELFSEVCLKLLENDCAVLRKFRGNSSLQAYLRTVIGRLLLDRLIQTWGKWRPTARALALGTVAVTLERLIGRDGFSPREAVCVATHDPECVRHGGNAVRLCGTVPRRTRASFIPLDAVAFRLGTEPTSPLAAAELSGRAAKLRATLANVLLALSPTDIDLLRRRYLDGTPVVEIARNLGVNQKRLYRRCDRVLVRLRKALERADVVPADVQEIVGHAATDVSGVLQVVGSSAQG